MTVVFLVRLGL